MNKMVQSNGQFKLTKGLLVAPPTFFNEDGSVPSEGILREQITKQCEWLVEGCVKGVFVTGTAAECMTLTVQEKIRCGKIWAEIADKFNLNCIWHIGCASVAETCLLAREAETGNWSVKPTAIATLPPLYHHVTGVTEIVDGLAEVSAAAPSLPLYYYHIPSFSGVKFSLGDILEEAHKNSEKVPTLVGAKFTHTELADMNRCSLMHNKKYSILLGTADVLLGGIAEGCDGFISLLANIPRWGQLSDKVIRTGCYLNKVEFDENDNVADPTKRFETLEEARELQLVINTVCRESNIYKGTFDMPAFLKGVMMYLEKERSGKTIFTNTMRLPQKNHKIDLTLQTLKNIESNNVVAKLA